jgi:hypothetical protein
MKSKSPCVNMADIELNSRYVPGYEQWAPLLLSLGSGQMGKEAALPGASGSCL